MGNSSGRESHLSGEHARPSTSPNSAGFPGEAQHSARASRSGRHDASFFGLAAGTAAGPETRRETRQEREARKLEKERAARLKERERSLREEGVDGGYLVTLGTYTGPEDFSKATVRQLMIERRIAPFWRGLNDHSDSWTEHQLVAAAKGKPIPAPDDIPDDEDLLAPTTPSAPPSHPGAMAVPGASEAQTSSVLLSTSHPITSTATSFSPSPGQQSTSSPLFRGRAKTLASLASSSKTQLQTDITPQEIQSPHDPWLNGMRIEAHLYKDVLECPICFMYYPPYLNKTRCCDQPICSECFVQIKRPDPHPPEHLDPNTPAPEGPPRPEETAQLVSEPATCPFCVTEEFGVTYQPPPFRRGLVYAGTSSRLARGGSAMSSSSDLSGVSTPVGSPPPNFTRRRTESLSANAPTVITTDKVRPDWAKKLSDARANQARRSAAATALHTAAYLMGNNQASSSANPFSRRRRAETTGSNGPTGQAGPDIEQLMAALESRRTPAAPGSGNADLWPPRGSSQRATTAQDIEEIMLMEAIRLSLAAEEERKKKEEKEAAKQAKKDEKQKVKDQKKEDKATKKAGLYSSSANSSMMLSQYGSSDGPSSPADGASAGRGAAPTSEDATAATTDGKGKARASSITSTNPPQTESAIVPLAEPTSTVSTETAAAREDPQKHLEQSRAQILAESSTSSASPIPTPAPALGVGNRLRGGSNASYASTTSSASYNESGMAHSPQRHDDGETPPSSSLEPMFNFSSLAEMIGKQTKEDGSGFGLDGGGAEHVEHGAQLASQETKGDEHGKYGFTNVGIVQDEETGAGQSPMH